MALPPPFDTPDMPSALGDDEEDEDASRPDSPNTEFQRLLVNIGLKPGRRDDISEGSEPDIDPRTLYEQETQETTEDHDSDFDFDPRELLYELMKDEETEENETSPCTNYQPFYESVMHGAIGQNEPNLDNNAYQPFSQPIAPETTGNVPYAVNSNDYESFDQPEEDATVGFLQFGQAEIRTVIKRRSAGRGLPLLYLQNIQPPEEHHTEPDLPILPPLPFDLNAPISMEQTMLQGFQPESHGTNIQQEFISGEEQNIRESISEGAARASVAAADDHGQHFEKTAPEPITPAHLLGVTYTPPDYAYHRNDDSECSCEECRVSPEKKNCIYRKNLKAAHAKLQEALLDED